MCSIQCILSVPLEIYSLHTSYMHTSASLGRTVLLLANISTMASTARDKSNPSQQEMVFDNMATHYKARYVHLVRLPLGVYA